MKGQARRGRGRGGQGGHEPRVRIRDRAARVLERSLQGWTQAQIAAELRVSQPAVSKILARAEDRLLGDHTAQMGRVKARMYMRLEHIYLENIRGWERSKDPTTRRRQQQVLGSGTGAAGIAELVTQEGPGDPRFLNNALHALMAQMKLWGLDAPPKLEVTVPDNPYASMATDTVKSKLRQLVQMFAAEDAAVPTVVPDELKPEPTEEERRLAEQRMKEEAYARHLAEREVKRKKEG